MEDLIVATTPGAMVDAQKEAEAWATRKMEAAANDLQEIDAVHQRALEEGLKSPVTSARRRAMNRRGYYEKLRQAFAAGYVLVPNFPAVQFAIRVDTTRKPQGRERTSSEWSLSRLTQAPPGLPAGEGEMVDPDPYCKTRSFGAATENDPDRKLWVRCAEKWDPDVALPAELAKVSLVDKAAEALKQPFFDALAIVNGQEGPRADPILVGQVFMRGRPRFYPKAATFFLAWFCDLTTL